MLKTSPAASGEIRAGVAGSAGRGNQLRSIACRSAVLAACALACALRLPSAEAQDVLTLRLGYTSTWDDNVFRVPDDAPDPEGSRGIAGKSDRFDAASIGLHLNKPLSMQRILLDATKSAIRYEKFKSLDRDPFNYRGAWQWQLTSRVSGMLSASRAESQVNFEDVEGARRVDQRTTTAAATADAWLSGGWHLLGGVSENKTTYSDPLFARPDTKQTSAEAGLRYVARSTSQLTVLRRASRGTEDSDPALFAASDFAVDETEASATWLLSGRSTLSGRLTYIERRYQSLPQRDFSGTAGELTYLWTPTGRLTLTLSAARSITPYILSVESTTRTENTIAAALVWRTSERTSLRSAVSRRESRFGQIGTSAEPARRDSLESAEVGANWALRRFVTLDASLRHEQRASTDAMQRFDAYVATLSIAFTF
jgi:exopolysaccharide biosynthesis operon protein EpsL